MRDGLFSFAAPLVSAALFETWPALVMAAVLLAGSGALGILLIPAAHARPALRALAGIPLFLIFGGSLGIFQYLLGGTTRLGFVLLVLFALASIAFALWRGPLRPRFAPKELGVLAFLLLLGFVLAWFGWGEARDGTIRSLPGAWGDGPLHVLIAEAFRRRVGPDLALPAFAGERFHEPFGYDFFAALLRAGGFTLGGAFGLPAAGLLACLLGWSGHLAARALENAGPASRWTTVAAAVTAAALTVGFGGLQWAVMAQRTGAWNLATLFGPHAVTWSKVEEIGLVWANHLDTFSSQKHLLLALTFFLVLSGTLLSVVRRRKTHQVSFASLVPWAIATGLLPLFHLHVFLGAGLLWLGALLVRPSKNVFRAGFLALLLALPVVVWYSGLFGRAGFLSFAPGWMAGPGARNWLAFWTLNLGIFLPLAGVALWRLWKRAREVALFLFVPAGLLFLLGNLIQFQPYRWDNFKLFLLAWLLMLPLVVAELYRWRFPAARVVAGGATLFMLLTTMVDLPTLRVFRATSPVYRQEDRDQANRLEVLLPRDAVVLAATGVIHNHPLTLTGRTLVSGYGGWIWTRAYPWEERAALASGALPVPSEAVCVDARRLGATHAVDQAFRVHDLSRACVTPLLTR